MTSRTTLAVLCLAQFMLILDVAVVAVALPAIQADLAMSASEVQALGTAYAVTFGGLLVLAGRLGDVAGSRRAFAAGLAAFVAASLTCALAPTAGVLLAGRALQGIGAAVASPAALALLMAAFPGEHERTKAFAAWGAVASGGAVAGQLIGGALTDALDWRWIFLVNVPIGVVVIAAALRLLPAPAPAAGDRALDLRGAALLTGGIGLLIVAATQATERGLDAVVAATTVAALAALAGFVRQERRASAPLVRLGLLAQRSVAHGNAVAFFAAGASTTVVFLAAIYLQRTLGLTPGQVGLGFAPVTLAIVAASGATARLVQRFGVAPTLVAAQALVAAGALSLSFVSAGGSYFTDVLPGLALVGVGSGLSYGPAMLAATSGIGAAEHGLATGIVSTAQQIGGALGLAVLTTVAFGGRGGDPAVLGDAGALAAGFRATALLPALAVLLALSLARGRGAPVPAAATS